MIPVCTAANPYHGDRSSHHPAAAPTRLDHNGHIIMDCPNCGRAFFTHLPPSALVELEESRA